MNNKWQGPPSDVFNTSGHGCVNTFEINPQRRRMIWNFMNTTKTVIGIGMCTAHMFIHVRTIYRRPRENSKKRNTAHILGNGDFFWKY